MTSVHARTGGGARGYTLMELMVTMTLFAVLLGLGVGAFKSIGKKTAFEQALADTAGLVNKARNASVRFPAAVVSDPDEGVIYGRTEQVLQELHFEPRPGEDDSVTFASGIGGLEVNASLGELLPRGGRVGGGLKLSGSPVECGRYPAYDVVDGISLELWISPDRLTATTLVDKGAAFSVRLSPTRGAARIEARIGVDDKGMRDEAALTADLPPIAVGDWLGVIVTYDRKALTIATDNGYGPVVRKSIPESRPLKPDTDAILRVGADFSGVIDDFRFGGVTVEDPIRLPEGVTLEGQGQTIHFRDGRLDARYHPGVVTIGLRDRESWMRLEIGQSGTVQSVQPVKADGDAAPAQDGDAGAGAGGGSGEKE